MIERLRSAVVLGAGTMGAQLACLLAGAGARVRLLDIDRGLAEEGLARARKARPTPLYRPIDANRIVAGGFEELVDAVADGEWVLEAIVEDLEAKRNLLGRVDEALGERPTPPTITTNTSALSVRAMAEGRSDAFRRVFLGTHFFNPPRYTRLLELVPTDETEPDRIAWFEGFASRHLGKGTVRANDTPAFIANRLGTHGMLTALSLAQELGLGPDEVDDLTGPLLGRPRSATFRTLDLVGLDVALAVADHCHAALPDDPEHRRFEAPPVLRTLVERGALGEKAGAGFYRRKDGEILALDLENLEYRPRRRVSSPTVERARNETELGRRLWSLIEADDATGRFLWRLLSTTLRYAAAVGPEIADDAWTVDQAMRWGFGWELGPFQTWDALGPASFVERIEAEGEVEGAGRETGVPELARTVAAGPGSFYREADDGVREALVLATASYRRAPTRTGALDPAERRADTRRSGLPELPGNASASMVDLGEGILGLELHGKLNIIGLDTIELLLQGIDLAERAYDGVVIGTRAADFSAGANLALLLLEAEEGEWDELDQVVRRFQQATRRMRYSPAPVVVAPRGRTLGGGAELCFPAARRQALAETYIGSTESALGLIPAGGGSTYLARRAAEAVPYGLPADPFPFFRRAFETAALARVSTGAEDARDLGLLEPADLVTADPDRQWTDAAAVARQLAEAGYRPPTERPLPVLGSRGIAAAEALTYNELSGQRLSEHDRKVALELARVMSGGDIAEGTAVAEDYLLDLEREAFLRLLGEPKTRERIRYTLKTGKPLRN
jgi:3-hydroxyacyl-CoA dehydrogenase